MTRTGIFLTEEITATGWRVTLTNWANRDAKVNFGKVGMPAGYSVWWLDSHEMYFWHREADDHWDGPYCDRFMARRAAVFDAKSKEAL